jgi:hypothetical protein
MRQCLKDPAFPDNVGACSAESTARPELPPYPEACNDDEPGEIAAPVLTVLARLEIDATRVW